MSDNSAKVTLLEEDYGTVDKPDPTWMVRFEYDTPDNSFKFLVHEPYCHTYDAWMKLADGERGMSFYMGNGEGSIRIEGDYMVFNASPSGAGGDVSSEYRIRKSIMCDHLKKVINLAKDKNLEFHNKK